MSAIDVWLNMPSSLEPQCADAYSAVTKAWREHLTSNPPEGWEPMKKPDQAEIELSDFIRRTEQTLDEPAQRQLEAAMRYIQGREEPARLDRATIDRKHRLYLYFRGQQ